MKYLFTTGFEREREREKKEEREERREERRERERRKKREKKGEKKEEREREKKEEREKKIGKGVLIVYDRGLHQKMMVMMMQGTRFPAMVVSMFVQC